MEVLTRTTGLKLARSARLPLLGTELANRRVQLRWRPGFCGFLFCVVFYVQPGRPSRRVFVPDAPCSCADPQEGGHAAAEATT